MDRRKFLKASATALAGATIGLTSCDEESFFPEIIPGKRSKRDEDKGYQAQGKSSSLFVASDRHEMGEGNNLPAILKEVSDKAEVPPQVVLLGGDYVGGGRIMTPEFPIQDLYDEIYSVFNPPTCDALFTYGSHDNCCTDGYSAFFSGPHRCDGYYIYGITYVQMVCATDADTNAAIALRSQRLLMGTAFEEFKDDDILIAQNGYNAIDIADRFGKSAESASASFLEWANSLSDNAPIVVMSHVPLHANRHDNYGGLIWFEALSKVAEKHDIIFLWGHNHTIEEKAKDYTDREDAKLMDRFFYLLTPADMLTPGDHIDIQGDAQTGVVSKRINFTYANAGYIKLGYGTVITFSDSHSSGSYDQVTFHRYGIDSISAETEIGFTGKKNPYTYSLTIAQKNNRVR